MGKLNIPYEERDGILYPCITFSEDVPIGKVGKYGLMWITYMKEKHDYRYKHLVRMGEVNLTAIEVDEEANAMADTIMKKYLKEHSPEDKSSTIEMWRLREQAKMMAEEVVWVDMVNRYR